MGKLAEKLLVDPEHLRWTILVLLTEGAADQAVKPYKHQLAILEGLGLEVAAFCYNVQKENLDASKAMKLMEKLDELREQCLSFLKSQQRELALASLAALKDEHRRYMNWLREERKKSS